MTPHALATMLEARSVAVVGASARADSLGFRMTGEALRSRGDRTVWLVNPSYAEVAGHACLPDLDAIGQAPDLVLLGVGDELLPDQLAAAARAGAHGAVVFGSAHAPGVRDRLRAIAGDAGMALCGGGCMGFWNVRSGLRAMGYVERDVVPVGPISVVTHSGSVFSTLLRTRQHLGFDLVVSSGQELVTTTADYVDHVVAHTDTRVLALVLETVRDGPRLRESLRRAREAGLDVVLLPVGGSRLGSAMVAAHSGAVAGDDATWEALCEDTGTIRVRDLAELTDTLALLSADRRPRPRAGTRPGPCFGIATVHDSGAERGLLADLTGELDVPLATITDATRARLAAELDAGLGVANPLDVWGGGSDTRELFTACLTAMVNDPHVAVTALAVDLVPEYDGDTSYIDAVLDVAARTDEPLAVLTNLASAIDAAAADRLRGAGVPVLEGTRSGLLALRHLLDAATAPQPPGAGPGIDRTRQRRWLDRLASPRPLDAGEVLELLAAYDVPAPAARLVRSEAAAAEAARALGGPVVLKTAEPAITHRSEVGGVRMALTDEASVAEAYLDLAGRLGPLVTVHQTADAGVELSIGMVRDPALGPMLVVAAGGVLVELLADRAVALPPVSAERAQRMVDRLRLRPLLDGWRRGPASDLDAVVGVVLAVSQIAIELGDSLDALELNPVIAGPRGAQAVDALVLARPGARVQEPACTA